MGRKGAYHRIFRDVVAACAEDRRIHDVPVEKHGFIVEILRYTAHG